MRRRQYGAPERGTRVVIGNRTAWTGRSGTPTLPLPEVGRRYDGAIFDPAPIPPDQRDYAPIPLSGQVWHDHVTDLAFRVVPKLDIQGDCWGTFSFWQKRYNPYREYPAPVKFRMFREWVLRGWFDAAIEEGSTIQRFRVRNEAKVLQWLANRFPRRAKFIA